MEDIFNGVKYGFEAVDKKTGNHVNEIHLRYRKEAITIITRKQFVDGDYIDVIKKGYIAPL